MYRCDLGAQYKALPKVSKPPRDPKFFPLPALEHAAQASPAGAVKDAGSSEPSSMAIQSACSPEGCSAHESASQQVLQSLLEFHAWSHMSETAGSRDFFSIAPQQALPVDAKALMVPLQEALALSSGQTHRSRRKLPLSICDGPRDVVIDMEFQDDCGVVPRSEKPLSGEQVEQLHGTRSSGPAKHSQHPHVLFRVIAGAPAKKKLARTDAGVELRPEHMVIQRCPINQLDAVRREVFVDCSPDTCKPELFQRPASLGSCLAWKVVRSQASFRGKSLSPEEQAALDQLLKAGGVHGSDVQEQRQLYHLSQESEHYDIYVRGFERRRDYSVGLYV